MSRIAIIQSRAAGLGAPLIIYVAVSLLLFGRGSLWRTGYLGAGSDPITIIWFLHWWPFAIWHGLNPFVTNYVWFRHGFNLTWATSVPFAALVMAPVTAWLGPVFSFNLLTIAAPALSAWTAFLLCQYVTDDWLAALIGGYLFGFSSYELGQMLGHLNLDFTCLVPLTLLICVRRVRRDMSGRSFIVALTACSLAELGISTEILATLCVFGAVTWLVFLAFSRPRERRMMLRMALEIAVAGVVTVILASPFLYYLVKGLADVPAQINAAQNYVTDPRNFIVPTVLTRLNTQYFLNIAAGFDGNISEQGAYLSVPLVLLTGGFFMGRIRRPYVPALLLVTLLLMIFSLGPYLQIGASPTKIPLLWLLTQHVPVLDQMLPSRFSMFISLSTGVATALALTAARGWLRWVNYGLAVAACIMLLPNCLMFAWSPWPVSRFFTAENVTERLGRMPNVLILPYAQTGPGMAWQLDAQMSFRQVGGYAGFIPASEGAFPAFVNLYLGVADKHAINGLDVVCASHGVNYVLLGPGTPRALAAAILAQGWPAQTVDGVTIVSVPPASNMDYYSISGDYWPAPSNWMGRQMTIVTHASPLHLKILGAWTRPSATMRISVQDKNGVAVYPIDRTTVIPVTIAANDTVTITSNETWLPDAATDPRFLSVSIEIDGP